MRLVTDSLNISIAKLGQTPSTMVRIPSGTSVRISRPLISGRSSYLGLSVPKKTLWSVQRKYAAPTTIPIVEKMVNSLNLS